jgi:hypothetical protein
MPAPEAAPSEAEAGEAYLAVRTRLAALGGNQDQQDLRAKLIAGYVLMRRSEGAVGARLRRELDQLASGLDRALRAREQLTRLALPLEKERLFDQGWPLLYEPLIWNALQGLALVAKRPLARMKDSDREEIARIAAEAWIAAKGEAPPWHWAGDRMAGAFMELLAAVFADVKLQLPSRPVIERAIEAAVFSDAAIKAAPPSHFSEP